VRLRFGECLFDLETRELLRGGSAVHLSPKAFRLLEALLLQRPKAASREKLHRILWPSTFVSDATLNGLVAEIRSGIGDDARKPRFLRTLPVFGYAFSGDAREIADPVDRAGPNRYRVFRDRQGFDLSEGDNVVGRGSDATVVIDDETVSRRHALIRLSSDGAATLEDLGSKNGTFLRGRRVKGRQRVEDGEDFLVGDVLVQFRRLSGATSTRSARRKLKAVDADG
jgi:DNA-binding winged helix-turn-helix (wHTH) protein